MAQIRILVGAALDPSARRVFDPLIEAANRARTRMRKAGEDAAQDYVGGYRTAPAKARKAHDDIAKLAEKVAKDQAKAAREEAKAYEHVYRIKQRYFDAEERADARAEVRSRKAADRARAALIRETRAEERARNAQEKSFIKGVAGGAASTFGGIVRGGVGMAREVAGGMGVQLDVGGAIHRATEAESKIVGTINQVKMAGGSGFAGGPAAMYKLAADSADKAAQPINAVVDAMAEFQAKSNDLKTGAAAVDELGKLSLAAGANFKDVGGSAAFVNAQLEDTPDRAEKLLAIMRAITMQTAAGQIELKDWAKYMPRIAAAANRFSGDYSKNIGTLSALAQISVAGGRSTAAEASNSAAALSRDLQKKATRKAWKGAGISLYTDASEKEMRPPEELIMDSLRYAKGSQAKLSDLWKNVVSAAPVMALNDVYNKAGGGQKGEEAVKAKLAEYDKSLSKADVEKLAADSLQTAAAKTQIFNNQLDRIASDTLPKLLPAMEQLAPRVVDVANGLAKVATYTAENPGQAIVLAAVASIGKAALGEAIKGAITGQLAAAGSLGAILSAALAGVAVAIMIDDAIVKIENQVDKEKNRADAEDINVASDLRAKTRKGTVTQADVDAAKARAEQLSGRMNRVLSNSGDSYANQYEIHNPFSAAANWLNSSWGESWTDQSRRFADKRDISGLNDDLANQMKAIEAAQRQLDAAGKHDAAADKNLIASERMAAAAEKIAAVAGGGGDTTGPVAVRR